MKNIFKSSFILASVISIFEASSALAFVEAPPNNPKGQIRFSATEVGSNKLTPAFTDSVFPNELLTPGQLYPEMSPVKQSQYKEGPLDLSDDYSSQYGKANITEVKFTLPNLAGLGWLGSGKFLDDTSDDGYALRNSSYAQGSWATEITGAHLDLVWLNVNGGLKPHINGTDAWVVGSFRGSFEGKNPSTPFEILFGFDGANQGRADFLSYNFGGTFGNINGGLTASGDDYSGGVSASADFGVDTFDVKLLAFSDLFGLNAGDVVNIQGTFNCAALNGYCGRTTDIPPEWLDRVPKVPRFGQGVQENVPGPLPILGLGAMVGYSRKLRKRIKSSKPEVISTTAQEISLSSVLLPGPSRRPGSARTAPATPALQFSTLQARCRPCSAGLEAQPGSQLSGRAQA